MSQGPYSSYHGRKRHGRSVLIGIVTALVILLAAVLAGYYFGLFNIPGAPGFPGTPVPHASPDVQPSAEATPSQEPMVIIDAPSPSPSSSPAAVSDLSGHTIRDIPLGLVLTAPDALPESGKNGVLVDMTDADLTALDGDFADKLAALPYAAAWLAPDWSGMKDYDEKATQEGQPLFQNALADRCAALAALGFDEIVFSAADPAKVGDASLAGTYTVVHDTLEQAGWQGRFGLDLDQAWFDVDSDVIISCIAYRFDRLYFRKTLSAGNKSALTDGGFEANGKTLVTVVKNTANLNYAWAILP